MGPANGGTDDRGSMFLPGMEEMAAGNGNHGSGSRSDSKDPQQSDFKQRDIDRTERPSNTIADMSADANQVNLNAGAPQIALESTPAPHPGNGQPHQGAPVPPREYVEPIWMRRSKLVMFVMACIYLGIVLVILPWNDVWTQNVLVHRYPALHDIVMNNFVRGAVTGLGFVNIWLGIWEAVSYREQRNR
jgi:hypothetical protein